VPHLLIKTALELAGGVGVGVRTAVAVGAGRTVAARAGVGSTVVLSEAPLHPNRARINATANTEKTRFNRFNSIPLFAK
jgi:hypothetical protein